MNFFQILYLRIIHFHSPTSCTHIEEGYSQEGCLRTVTGVYRVIHLATATSMFPLKELDTLRTSFAFKSYFTPLSCRGAELYALGGAPPRL